MYEIDFTGWVRTPEAIEELVNNNWLRRKFHFKRLFLAIYKRRWWHVKYNLECVLTNTKSI